MCTGVGSTGRQEQEGEDERGEKGGNGEKRKRKKVYVCVGGYILHICVDSLQFCPLAVFFLILHARFK